MDPTQFINNEPLDIDDGPPPLTRFDDDPEDEPSDIAATLLSLKDGPVASTQQERPFLSSSHTPIRQSYTLKHKRHVVTAVDLMKLDKPHMSIRAICRKLNVKQYFYTRWKKTVDSVMNTHLASTTPGNFVTGLTRKVDPGRPGVLVNFESDLFTKILELRDQGLPVTVRRITVEACKLDPSFASKTPIAQKHVISRYFIVMVRSRLETSIFSNREKACEQR